MTFAHPGTMRRTIARIVPLAFALLCSAAAGADAQGTRSAQQQADVREMQAFRLDDAKIGRWIRAQEEMLAYARDNEQDLKALEKKMKAEQESEDDDAEPTLTQMAARMEKVPPFRQALQRAGTNSREFMLTTLVMFQAGFAAELMKSGTIKELPKEVPSAHVALYNKYSEQFRKLSEEQKALEKRREAAEEEEEEEEKEPR